METLKKHLPFSGPEGMNELRRIAARFEERVFRGAINQTDYLRKISMKMLTMETKLQNAAGSSSSTFPGANCSRLPLNPGNHMDYRFYSRPCQFRKPGPTVNTGDWRSHLPRKMNANKVQEGIKELMKIADSFEELIFNTAIDQVDYFRKISFRIQTME